MKGRQEVQGQQEIWQQKQRWQREREWLRFEHAMLLAVKMDEADTRQGTQEEASRRQGNEFSPRPSGKEGSLVPEFLISGL